MSSIVPSPSYNIPSTTSIKRTIPVMPYMMTKFLGHLGDKVSFKRYLMLRVLPLRGNRVQQVVDEPLPKGSFQSEQARESLYIPTPFYPHIYCGIAAYNIDVFRKSPIQSFSPLLSFSMSVSVSYLLSCNPVMTSSIQKPKLRYPASIYNVHGSQWEPES